MKKVNKKRLFISILVLIIIIVTIVFAIKFSGNGDETSGDFNMDGSQETVDSQNSQEGGEEKQPDQTTAVPDQSPSVSDAPTTSVPQQETENVTEFIDESGNKLEEDTLQTSKDSIIQAFKAIPSEKLGITADLSTAKIMFNQGITTIADKDCFVFNVYVLEDGKLKNIGTYAMSRDTEVLYKLNSETSDYDLIEK